MEKFMPDVMCTEGVQGMQPVILKFWALPRKSLDISQNEDANDDTSMLVNYLVTRLHQAMGNPALQGEVQQQLHAYGILPPIQQERGPERFKGETSKRGHSTEKGVENPYQALKQLLEGKPSSKKKGHAQHERSSSREREESESLDESMEDVAPRRRRAQRSPTPTKWKRSPHSPHRHESKREEKNSKKKERKRSPSSPSSSPSSSLDEDKVLAFIQQFDAMFGDEGFMEFSKLRHVAMHFQKSARQWWASLRANGEAPKTWKALKASIMKKFLASDAKDKVLTKWRSLKLSPYESIHKYEDKFWDLHLKATVYKKIDFEEQKQQLCAGLPEDMNEYVNSQRPRSISVVIHHTMVVARINFQQGAKRNLKPMEAKEKQEYKGKNVSQNSSKGNSNNNKAKEKGVFKGMPTIAHDIMAERYFAREHGQDVWAWIRLVEREMQYLGIEDDEAKADYAHQGLEREAYVMYNRLVEDAQCCWNTLKLVLVLMYWELPVLAESDDFVQSFFLWTYEGDGKSKNNKQNLSWHNSTTLDAFDELHDANIDLRDSNCFDAKLETCDSSTLNLFNAESTLHADLDLMYDGDVSSFDESNISSWSFWDEVGTPVGGDIVVDLDASACNFPVYIYATECRHGSMFSKKGVQVVLDESEMPSVLDNPPNIWMKSTTYQSPDLPPADS
ncbi:hypothetical protein L7F22_035613 [Adiantum nelumboides]|nr:hypothetical protein [Adiantum nelumboides]